MQSQLESKFLHVYIYISAKNQECSRHTEKKMKKIYSSYIRTYCEAKIINTAWYQHKDKLTKAQDNFSM